MKETGTSPDFGKCENCNVFTAASAALELTNGTTRSQKPKLKQPMAKQTHHTNHTYEILVSEKGATFASTRKHSFSYSCKSPMGATERSNGK